MSKILKHDARGLPASFLSLYQWIATGRTVRKVDKETGEFKDEWNPKAPAVGAWNQRRSWKQYKDVGGCAFPGFCLTRGTVCFDFDQVADDDGNLTPKAQRFKERMIDTWGPTYIEESCSRHGLHAFYHVPKDGLGTLAGKRIDVPLDGGGHVEIWIGGETYKNGKKTADSNRQFALTGWRTKDSAADVAQAPSCDFLQVLADESAKRKQNRKQPNEAPQQVDSITVRKAQELPPPTPAAPPLSVEEIPAVIRRSKSGALFKQLFDDGEIAGVAGHYISTSEAHMALMNMLPFYCAGDTPTMIEVFKQSALYANMREDKKGRDDYLPRTAEKALASWNGKTYTRKKKKKASTDVFFPDLDEKSGKPVGMTEENLQALMDALGVEVADNEMSKDLEFYGDLFQQIPDDGNRSTNCITKLRGEGIKRGLKAPRDDWTTTIELIASKNKRSPSREFLLQAKAAYLQAVHDGNPRDFIKETFERFKLDPEDGQDVQLCSSLFTRWLVAAARAPFNSIAKGDQYQGVLVLVGPQHIGKTRFLLHLVPDARLRAVGLKVNPTNKDSVWKVVRKWGVELGEFGTTMTAKRVEDLKNFVTSDSDTFRKPYAKAPQAYPRQTFFYASTNQKQFLCDETGDRRYWQIVLKGIDFTGWTAETSRLLWGQVMTLAFAADDTDYTSKKAGKVQWWPTDKEFDALEAAQESHNVESEEVAALKDILDWEENDTSKWMDKTATETINILSEYRKGRDLSPVKLGKELKRMMRTDKRILYKRGAHGSRRYRIPPVKSDVSIPLGNVWCERILLTRGRLPQRVTGGVTV